MVEIVVRQETLKITKQPILRRFERLLVEK